MPHRPLQRPGGIGVGSSLRLVALVLIVLGAVVAREWLTGSEYPVVPTATYGATGAPTETAPPDDEEVVLDLFRSRRSGEMVTVAGIVHRTLTDDNEGSRHQRFIVRLSSGHTLMVAHNIDIAERAPLQEGDRVRLRGQYEWNDQGGVLHWTHHDPDGDHEGGWIEAGGDRYR